MNAYDYGKIRGRNTGRSEVRDRDYQWVADESEGEMQCTDPQDAVDFGAGMRDGAAEREDGAVVS